MSADSYKTYCEIRDRLGYKDSSVASGAGITKSTFSDWKAGRYQPKQDKMQKIADFFGVSLTYLMTGEEQDNEESSSQLTEKDNRDIAKDLENIKRKLMSGEDGPASYDGQILSPESAELFMEEIEIALKRLKIINKEKYNPNKNKKQG